MNVLLLLCIENLGEIECIWGFTVIIYCSLVKITSGQEVLDHVHESFVSFIDFRS
jgi:hypothetical protein